MSTLIGGSIAAFFWRFEAQHQTTSAAGQEILWLSSREVLLVAAAQRRAKLPTGQYLTTDFPVLSAGPTPHISLDRWEFTIDDGSNVLKRWDWKSFRELPTESFMVDLHCVTRRSKLGTSWEGVSLDVVLADVKGGSVLCNVPFVWRLYDEPPSERCYEQASLDRVQIRRGRLEPQHGGPARLLVPHLYLWKSAKWVKGMTLMPNDKPGFWENLGYHIYGDPLQEQRYSEE